MKIIKQYGIERSGTNYIKALIELNSTAIVLSILFGGKHDKYFKITKDFDPFENKWVITDLSKEQILQIKDQFLKDNILYLVSIKNPYAWFVSFREFCEKHKSDKVFIQPAELDAISLIKYWNELNFNWIDNLSSKNYYVVSYDKLIQSPFEEIRKIFNKFDIQFLNENIVGIENNMLEGPDTHGSKNISENIFDKKDYYTSGEYIEKLSEYDLEIIEKYADKDLSMLL